MFDLMRRMIVPIIIVVLVFFVGLIIFQWGGLLGTGQTYNRNLAGIINDEEIDFQFYNSFYNNLYQAEIAQSEDELPDARIQELQQIAWSQVVEDRLLNQEAQKSDITVTDDELYSFLRLTPPPELQSLQPFQTNGQFDYNKYLNALADPQAASFWNQITPSMRQTIMKLKVQSMVIEVAGITEPEIKNSFMSEKEKVKVGMINVAYGKYRANLDKPNDDDVLAYYNNHLDEFYSDEKARLDYVEIKDDPSDLDWEDVYTDIMVIYDSVMADSDFAEMAKVYSADATSEGGGDLGWFPAGAMVPEFDSLAFKLKKDDISPPFRTRFGWHIIKHHGYKDSLAIPPRETERKKIKFAHVSHILLNVKISQRTMDEIYKTLNRFLDLASDKTFAEAAEELELNVLTTGVFGRGPTVPVFGPAQDLNDLGFNGKIGRITEIRSSRNGYYVATVAEHIPEGIALFENCTRLARTKYKNSLLAVITADTAQAIYDEIQKGTKAGQATSKYGLEYSTPPEFSRTSYVRGIGRDPKAIGAAFTLPDDGKFSKPIKYDQGCVIMKLLKRTEPDLTEYNSKRDSVASNLLLAKQQQLYSDWYENLVKNSAIKNYTTGPEAIDSL